MKKIEFVFYKMLNSYGVTEIEYKFLIQFLNLQNHDFAMVKKNSSSATVI